WPRRPTSGTTASPRCSAAPSRRPRAPPPAPEASRRPNRGKVAISDPFRRKGSEADDTTDDSWPPPAGTVGSAWNTTRNLDVGTLHDERHDRSGCDHRGAGHHRPWAGSVAPP